MPEPMELRWVAIDIRTDGPTGEEENSRQLLADGWEPFAVEGQRLWFRRAAPQHDHG